MTGNSKSIHNDLREWRGSDGQSDSKETTQDAVVELVQDHE
jgi:hypothetical protein